MKKRHDLCSQRASWSSEKPEKSAGETQNILNMFLIKRKSTSVVKEQKSVQREVQGKKKNLMGGNPRSGIRWK